MFVIHCFASIMLLLCIIREEDANPLSIFHVVCLSERLVVGVGIIYYMLRYRS